MISGGPYLRVVACVLLTIVDWMPLCSPPTLLPQEANTGVIVAKADCTTNEELRVRFGVTSFPTLILFADRQLYRYKGIRNLESMESWVTPVICHPYSELSSANLGSCFGLSPCLGGNPLPDPGQKWAFGGSRTAESWSSQVRTPSPVGHAITTSSICVDGKLGQKVPTGVLQDDCLSVWPILG